MLTHCDPRFDLPNSPPRRRWFLLALLGLLLAATMAHAQTAKVRGDATAESELVLVPASMEFDPAKATSLRRIEAKDPGKLSGRPADKQPTPGWTTLVYETAEGNFPDDNGWDVFDGDAASGLDYWDDVSCRSFSGSWSIWCADVGDSPDCTHYDNDMTSWMIFGPFSLADAMDAQVEFRVWSETEAPDVPFDSVFWGASANGTSFNGIRLGSNTGGWASRTFDLTNVPTLGDLRGDPTVWFAFVFTSDSSINSFEGTYVDEIVIEKLTASPGLSAISGLIVPGFEVDLSDTNGASTLFAVRNTSNSTRSIDVDYYGYDAAGSPLRTDSYMLAPQSFLPLNVRANTSGLLVEGNTAKGLIVINQAGGGAANLEGDYFRIDFSNDFATGDRLVRPSEFCNKQEVRFVDFGSGSELRILLDQPPGAGPAFSYTAYNQAGGIETTGNVSTSDNLVFFDAADLVSSTNFGALVFDFTNSGGGWASAKYSAFGRFSVELNSACRD
jgi:hypothetical protein